MKAPNLASELGYEFCRIFNDRSRVHEENNESPNEVVKVIVDTTNNSSNNL